VLLITVTIDKTVTSASLPLYVNSLSSCLSYVSRGIASVTGYC